MTGCVGLRRESSLHSVGTTDPRVTCEWGHPSPAWGRPGPAQGCDEQEEDEEGAGLRVRREVRQAERARPRRTGDRASEGLHHLCSD